MIVAVVVLGAVVALLVWLHVDLLHEHRRLVAALVAAQADRPDQAARILTAPDRPTPRKQRDDEPVAVTPIGA